MSGDIDAGSSSSSALALSDAGSTTEAPVERGHAPSEVWKYFRRLPDSEYAICTFQLGTTPLGEAKCCGAYIKFTFQQRVGGKPSTSTSSMIKHLRILHDIRVNVQSKPRHAVRQSPLRTEQANRMITYFILKTFQPLSLVRNPAWRELLDFFDSSHASPAVKTLKEKHLMYVPPLSMHSLLHLCIAWYVCACGCSPVRQAFREEIGEGLKASPGFTIVFDGWSQSIDLISGVRRGFIGVSVSYFERLKLEGGAAVYVPRHAALACRKLTRPHSAPRIRDLLVEVLNDHDVPVVANHRIAAGCTDNANAECCATGLLLGDDKHVPCLCHTIHLSVKDALELPQVRLLVSYRIDMINANTAFAVQVKFVLNVVDKVVDRVRAHVQLSELLEDTLAEEDVSVSAPLLHVTVLLLNVVLVFSCGAESAPREKRRGDTLEFNPGKTGACHQHSRRSADCGGQTRTR